MSDDAEMPARSEETQGLPPTTRFSARLRAWLRPAGTAGGAYLFAGASRPCCGSVCPVGAVVVGGLAAMVTRLWHLIRSGVSAIYCPSRSSSSNTSSPQA